MQNSYARTAGNVSGAAITHDSNYLITAGAAQQLFVWRLTDGELVHIFNENTDGLNDEAKLTSLSISQDGRCLLTIGHGEDNRGVILWNLETLEPVVKFSDVFARYDYRWFLLRNNRQILCYSHGEQSRLFTIQSDNEVTVRDIGDGKITFASQLSKHDDIFMQVRRDKRRPFAVERATFANRNPSDDTVLPETIWSATLGSCTEFITLSSAGKLYAVPWTNEYKLDPFEFRSDAQSARQRLIRVFDTQTGRQLEPLKLRRDLIGGRLQSKYIILDAACNHAGNKLFLLFDYSNVISQEQMLVCCDLVSQKVLWDRTVSICGNLKSSGNWRNYLHQKLVMISPDDKSIVTIANSGFQVWDAENGDELSANDQKGDVEETNPDLIASFTDQGFSFDFSTAESHSQQASPANETNADTKADESLSEPKLESKDKTHVRKLLKAGDLPAIAEVCKFLSDADAPESEWMSLLSKTRLKNLLQSGDPEIWNLLAGVSRERPILDRLLVELAENQLNLTTTNPGKIEAVDSLLTSLVEHANDEVFEWLNQTRCHLYLTTETISETAASRLARFDGPVFLPKLVSLTDAPGHVELAKKLGDQVTDLSFDSLTGLGGKAAQALGNLGGDLTLSELVELSDAAAQGLSCHQGELKLLSLSKLSDAAAKSLVSHPGALVICFDDLTETAAEILREHPSFADKTTITKEIAAQFLEDNESVYLPDYTKIAGDAAELLTQHTGTLSLDGLRSLSATAAAQLAKHVGTLSMGDLEDLSSEAAENLIDHKGCIFMTGLIDLTDEAAESLAKRAAKFSEYEITLDDMPHSAAAILRDAGHGV